MWSAMPALIVLACQIGQPTVDPQSESARLAGQVQQIDDRVKSINALAHELETNAAEARNAVEAGQATPSGQVEKIQQLIHQIEAENKALQSEMDALESELPRSE